MMMMMMIMIMIIMFIIPVTFFLLRSASSVTPLAFSSSSFSSLVETSSCGMEKEEDEEEVSGAVVMGFTNCTLKVGGGWYDISSCRSEEGGWSLSGKGGMADTPVFSVWRLVSAWHLEEMASGGFTGNTPGGDGRHKGRMMSWIFRVA